MNNLLEFNSWLNEDLKWTQGGWIIIKGKPNKDGKHYLFAAQVKTVSELGRQKVGGKAGIPVNMTILYPDFYGVIINSSDNIAAIKLMSTPEYIEKWVGLKGLNVGLNKNKLINWRETINQTSLAKVLKENESLLRGNPDVIIPKK
jgi:hypothetical protein